MESSRREDQASDTQPSVLPTASHSPCNISGARHVCTFNNSFVCALFPVSFVHTTYPIPQREQEREERPLIFSLVKFLDLLLTTFRLLGRGVVTGGERKEIYILYINIYVNCIVLLYRHWHYCLPPPSPSLLWTHSLAFSDCFLCLPGFHWRGLWESGWGLRACSVDSIRSLLGGKRVLFHAICCQNLLTWPLVGYERSPVHVMASMDFKILQWSTSPPIQIPWQSRVHN